MVQLVKNLPAKQETWVQSLGWEDLLEKGQATHSSILGLQLVKNLPAMRETPVRFLGREDLLEKGQATHSSILGLQLVKNLPAMWETWFHSWVGKISWRRE